MHEVLVPDRQSEALKAQYEILSWTLLDIDIE